MQQGDIEVNAPGQRRLRTRQALIAAGLSLFSQRPSDSVSIDEIVGQAGVAKGSFYNHFADKNALLVEITSDVWKTNERRIMSVNATVKDPAARICRAVCMHAAFALSEPEKGTILLRYIPFIEVFPSQDPQHSNGVHDLEEGLHSGRLRPHSIDSAYLFTAGVTQSLLGAAITSGDALLTLNCAQHLCSYLLIGLGVERSDAEQVAAQAADDILRRVFHTVRA